MHCTISHLDFMSALNYAQINISDDSQLFLELSQLPYTYNGPIPVYCTLRFFVFNFVVN